MCPEYKDCPSYGEEADIEGDRDSNGEMGDARILYVLLSAKMVVTCKAVMHLNQYFEDLGW